MEKTFILSLEKVFQKVKSLLSFFRTIEAHWNSQGVTRSASRPTAFDFPTHADLIPTYTREDTGRGAHLMLPGGDLEPKIERDGEFYFYTGKMETNFACISFVERHRSLLVIRFFCDHWMITVSSLSQQPLKGYLTESQKSFQFQRFLSVPQVLIFQIQEMTPDTA